MEATSDGVGGVSLAAAALTGDVEEQIECTRLWGSALVRGSPRKSLVGNAANVFALAVGWDFEKVLAGGAWRNKMALRVTEIVIEALMGRIDPEGTKLLGASVLERCIALIDRIVAPNATSEAAKLPLLTVLNYLIIPK